VQAAALTFFNKDVTELNLIESAALAAIVQGPKICSDTI
jgi:membrane peptidoglycan carboxypeptidase